ncbi:glycosyltransferase family 2 protein [uncultured Desulfuromusa sp.]|uniref:glycosyltransferase family 2 protein n=1 Tax=uncultured Desulfuromusa sp. TaxID=219183 RepID=UPI002AA72A70|nr:glycosyltransferase family 2 protein [uncultured Desulfuromusa sp.]
MEAVFILSLLLIIYVYLGYPLIVSFLSRLRHNPVNKSARRPKVTILIAAFNEAKVIAATIDNKLTLDYPSGKLEIIVISDESTDGTDEIVHSYADQGVRLIRQEPRAGKTSALNLAVPQATGEIIVFSDANSLYDGQALKKLVSNFGDKSVGYVSGKMIYTDVDGTTNGDGCSAYMKYENVLRAAESDLGSIVGVDGGIDAMRKKLYRSMNADQLPDFVQPLMVVEQGYRVVYEPKAILKESSLDNAADEYRMRVRVSLRAMWALYDMRHLLSFRNKSLFSWQLWSHKVLRYLCFIPLLSVFLSNLFLLGTNMFFTLFLGLQVCAYTVAFSPSLFEGRGVFSKIVTFIRYFVLLNVATAHAFLKFMLRQKQVIWTPRKG